MAAPTVVKAQALVAQRIGPAAAALVNLNDCLAYAFRSLGLTTADPILVADTDLAGLVSSQYDQFYDVAEWAALARALNNLDPTDLRRAGIEENPAELERRLLKREQMRRNWIEKAYGVGLQPLIGGSIELDFAAQNDNIPDPAF